MKINNKQLALLSLALVIYGLIIYLVSSMCENTDNQKVKSSRIPVDNILNVDVLDVISTHMETQIFNQEGFVVAHSNEKIMDISQLHNNCNYYVRVWSDSIYSKIHFIHKI